MVNPNFNDDVTQAELLDKEIFETGEGVEDIQGSLTATADEIEKIELSEHHKEMIAMHTSAKQTYKGDVYAVADEKALEHYVDYNGNLVDGELPEEYIVAHTGESKDGNTLVTQGNTLTRKHGPNVFGSFEYFGLHVPGNEGFLDLTSGIMRKATIAFGNEMPKKFAVTAKGLKHYISMAKRLRERLNALRPLLDKRDYPYRDVFDYGAYSRFFQFNGKPLANFYEFQTAMTVQSDATRHVISAASSYGVPIMEKLLETLQGLRVEANPNVDTIINLRNVVSFSWEHTWRDATITKQTGQVPQAAYNAFPERKFSSIAPLLDNRYLAAHEPKSDGGKDPFKITESIKHYGASIVFDKAKGVNTVQSMVIPNIAELIEMTTQVSNTLHDLEGLQSLVDKNESFAKDFKRATDVLNKAMGDVNDTQFFGFAREYFKLATSVGTAIQKPYVEMAWLYIRCAMVVTAMVELAVLEDPKKQVVTSRFLSKQNTEFTNPALESYEGTQKALRASVRAALKK